MALLTFAEYQTYIESSNSMNSVYYRMLEESAEKQIEAKLGYTYYQELLTAIAGGYTSELEDEMLELIKPYMSYYILNDQMTAPKVVPTQQGAKSLSSQGVEYDAEQLKVYQQKVFGRLCDKENELNRFIVNNAATLSSSIDIHCGFLKPVNQTDQIGSRFVNYGFQI